MKFGFWERRKATKAFEKYISPGVLRLIEASPPDFPQEPRLRHFQFVVVLLDDSHPDNVPGILERITEACLLHRSMISDISSTLVIACLGVPFADSDSVDARLGLVNTLVTENRDQIRLAHGQCNGRVGNLGGSPRFVYGAVIPGFNDILKQLLDSPNGTVVEINTPSS